MAQNYFQNFTIQVKRGDTVFDEGEKGRTMYIVQSGLVGLYQQVNGDRMLLGTMERGDFFGEMSILEGLPRTVSAVAEEDAALIEINNSVFDKMIRGNIEIAVRMLRKLSIRLREAESMIANLQTGDAQAARPRATATAELGQATEAMLTGARLQADGQEVAFALGEQDTLIGRFDPVTQQKPDIDLTELDLKRSVSRQHARIVRTTDGYALVEEVGALNGTFVNDDQLPAGQLHVIHEGDRLTIGSVSLIFHA